MYTVVYDTVYERLRAFTDSVFVVLGLKLNENPNRRSKVQLNCSYKPNQNCRVNHKKLNRLWKNQHELNANFPVHNRSKRLSWRMVNHWVCPMRTSRWSAKSIPIFKHWPSSDATSAIKRHILYEWWIRSDKRKAKLIWHGKVGRYPSENFI